MMTASGRTSIALLVFSITPVAGPAAAPSASCAAAPARTGHASAFDGGRRATMIFGGESADGRITNDLLAWDGSRWSCVTTATGPSPRTDAVLAHDPARGVLVLYGGRAGRVALRDTWEFSETGWTLRDSAGPTPEAHGVAAYDSDAKGILMHSGLGDDGPSRATWRWDGRTWTKVADGPPSQFPNAMVERDGRAMLMTAFRNAPPTPFAPALHRWGSAGWQPVVLAGVLPGFSPQAPAAATRAGALLYAGFERDRSVTTWVLDGLAWRRHDGESPSRRKGTRMTFDPVRSVVVMHGGDDGSATLDETWEWDGAWRRVR